MNRRNIVKTLHSSMLATSQMFKLAYTPIPISTLNLYHNISGLPSDDDYSIGHFILGLADIDLLNGNTMTLDNIEHQPYDANVAVPIPIFMKINSETVTSSERAKYKLFTTINIGNDVYNVAYAKAVETITPKEPYFVTHNSSDGYSIDSLNSANLDYLNPVTTRESVSYPDTLKFVAHATSVHVTITEAEMNNIRGYIDLIYPNRTGANKYRIQEIGLTHAQFTTINAQEELRNAQVAYFINVTPKDLSSPSVNVNIDIGNLMPIQLDTN